MKQQKEAYNNIKLGSFLGLCGVFWRFVLSSDRVVALLHEEHLKDQPNIFGPLINGELDAIIKLQKRSVRLKFKLLFLEQNVSD